MDVPFYVKSAQGNMKNAAGEIQQIGQINDKTANNNSADGTYGNVVAFYR